MSFFPNAVTLLRDQGFTAEQIHRTCYLNMRYQGTDTTLMIPEPEDGNFENAFKNTYRREFGFDVKDRDILVDDLRVRSRGKAVGLRKVPIEKTTGPATPR